MSQKLVVVSQQSSCLLWFHAQSSAQGVQDEFKSRFSLAWVLTDDHLHDIHSVFHWLLLGRLKASSTTRSIAIIEVLDLIELPVILTVVIEV
jgi:hypothetical protein